MIQRADISDACITIFKNYRSGIPLVSSDLGRLGVPRELVEDLVEQGALKSFGAGAWCLPQDEITSDGAAAVLLREYPELHVGGERALNFHGVVHAVWAHPFVDLYGTKQWRLPPWAKDEAFSVFYHQQTLFDFSSDAGTELDRETVKPCPSAPFGLRSSVPERALLEMLDQVGRDMPAEDAFNLWTSICPLRSDVIGPLLAACRRQRVVRLFFSFAHMTNFSSVDPDELVRQYPIKVGRQPLDNFIGEDGYWRA